MDNELFKQPSPVSKTHIGLAIINYFLGYFYVYPFIAKKIVFLRFGQEGITIRAFLVISVITMAIEIGLLYPYLVEGAKTFKKDFRKILSSVFYGIVLIFAIGGVLSFLASFLSGSSTSMNQETFDSILIQYPRFRVFSAVIFAPIVEELIFRGIFYRSLRPKISKTWCVIISGFLFGLVHILTGLLQGNFSELPYILVYGSLGAVFAIMMDYSQNIYTSIIIHFFYNLLCIILG